MATPRCARCVAKHIPCVYINQPSGAACERHTAPQGAPRQNEHLHVVGSASPLSKLAFERGPLFGLWTHIPTVVRLFEPIIVQRQLDILKSFVINFARTGTTSFLHPFLYGTRLPGPLQYVSRTYRNYGLNEDIFANVQVTNLHSQTSQMLRSAAKAGPFSELLGSVQAIALLRIVCLFQEQQSYSTEDAECDDEIFWELVMILYIRAPAKLPRTLSSWRAWLLAESVRRTILVCYVILAIQGVLRRGYAAHSLCVEALPFDMRAKIWDVDTADAWEAATATSHEPQLVSLRQFITLRQFAQSAPPLESLLLLFFRQLES